MHENEPLDSIEQTLRFVAEETWWVSPLPIGIRSQCFRDLAAFREFRKQLATVSAERDEWRDASVQLQRNLKDAQDKIWLLEAECGAARAEIERLRRQRDAAICALVRQWSGTLPGGPSDHIYRTARIDIARSAIPEAAAIAARVFGGDA